MPSLLFAKGQVVAAEAEFDGITHRSPADDFHLGAVAEAHFEEATTNVRVAANGEYMPLAADAQLVQAAGFRGAAMVAGGEFTSFLHDGCSVNRTEHRSVEAYDG